MSISQQEIEGIFRNSNSSDDLFDAFRRAITNKVADIELYKILLANPALTGEELKMYTEHLSKVFIDNAYDLFIWTGSIFANYASEYERLEDSISYFVKAIYKNPSNHEPFIKLLQMYNFDLELPTNKVLLEIVEDCISRIEKKSIVYNELARIYEKVGLKGKCTEYNQLALKYSRLGC